MSYHSHDVYNPLRGTSVCAMRAPLDEVEETLTLLFQLSFCMLQADSPPCSLIHNVYRWVIIPLVKFPPSILQLCCQSFTRWYHLHQICRYSKTLWVHIYVQYFDLCNQRCLITSVICLLLSLTFRQQ